MDRIDSRDLATLKQLLKEKILALEDQLASPSVYGAIWDYNATRLRELREMLYRLNSQDAEFTPDKVG